MRIIKLTLLLLLFSFNTFSQTSNKAIAKGDGLIKGKVSDKGLNKSIEYANIVLFSEEDSSIISGTITDTSGQFILPNLPYGKYYLTVDFIGYYKIYKSDIILSKNKKLVDLGDIKLEQSTENIKGVEIVGEKSYIDYQIDKKIVNVSQHINAANGTASDVLENVPSVRVDIEGNVLLRGSGNFTVLIDGRPSVLSGNDILKQMPASVIDKIEIITNPSAKYDPDGTAGIINLVMKKEKNKGFNGIINASIATGDKYGGDLTFNYRNKKVNYFISANYNRHTNNAESRNDRELYYSVDTTNYLSETTIRKRVSRPWRVNTGADLYLSDKNTLTIAGTIGGFGMFRNFDTKYHLWDNPATNELYSISDNYFEVDGIYYAGRVDFQRQFDGQSHKLDISIAGWQWDGDDIEESNQQNSDNNWNPTGNASISRSNHNPIRNNIRGNIDYVKPFGKGKIETGMQLHLTNGTSNFIYEDFNSANNTWVKDLNFSNEWTFDRGLYSAYGTYSNSFKEFQYQLGCRLEYTDRLLHQITTDEKYPVYMFNYYPTVHISKKLKKEQQLQLSYTRRINRPQPYELNPFPDYSDNYNYSSGNPLLKPEDFDSYEFNYFNKIKKGFVSLGCFYRQTNNTKLMTVNIDANNIAYITYDNLDKTSAYGMEMLFNWDLKKWCNLNLAGNVYNYEIKSVVIGENLNQNSNSWDSRLTATFKFSTKTRIQLMCLYVSPGVEGQGKKKELYYADLAFRHDFLNRKATFTIAGHNIFSTGKFENETRYNNFYSYFYYKNESPVIRVGLSYRINNYKGRKQDDIEIGR